jgi:putative membrane protein
MLAAALIAFGHFLAFFALTAALVLELALIAESVSVETARRIQRADRAAGLAAVLVLVFGLLRVFYFEKGSAYYFSNTWFLVKFGLFIAAALISVYPTLQFLRWRRELDQGIAPVLGAAAARRLKRAIHWELVLIAGILLCASLMARGFGV